jgi:hypothetical protein
VTTPPDYEGALKAAEKEFEKAETADDVRRIWKKYYLTVGHRSLGRILTGRPALDLIARRQAKRDEAD